MEIKNQKKEQFRVVINREANLCLEKMVAKANEGFDAGTITRSDFVNFIFIQLEKSISESQYKALRALHFDEKKFLGSLFKADQELPEEITKALRAHYGFAEKEKKRELRPAVKLSTEKDVDKSA